MYSILEERKRQVARWSKCLDRHWDKVDNEPDWNKKDKVMYSMAFVGASLKYISELEQYTKALENRIKELSENKESVSKGAE